MKPPSTSSHDSVISINALSCRFGSKRVLEDVNLHVPRGCVFGLVGENGAGKTTTIKHILGLLRPEAGQVRVCGRDPVADPVGVLSRVGYLSEHRDLPAWMRVDELLLYTGAFYTGWDQAFAESLRDEFELDPAKRIRDLSQGQQAKAGLLVALAYRPDLLVLDEPSSGLDPVVRRDMLEMIIRSVANEGRTVFFSSHLLDEIERVCDYLAIIHQGRLRATGRMDALQEGHRRLSVHFERALSERLRVPQALEVSGAGRSWTILCRYPCDDIVLAIRGLGGEVVQAAVPSLDELFFAVIRQPKGTHNELTE